MSEILVNKLTGTSTAGSILVTGEGNSTTTNLQQGLCKMWIHFDGYTGNDIRDSFNISSAADTGTGRYRYTFSNNMSNFYYSYSVGIGGNGDTRGDENYGSTGATDSANGFTTSTLYTRSRRYDSNNYDLDSDTRQIFGDLA